MALLAFNRKKQFFAPEVELLIKQLTDFEENDKNYQEVARYTYANLINHNFTMVDITSVQRSVEGIIEKLKIHGLIERSKRMRELVDKFISSDESQYSKSVKWDILLLLLRLSYKPLSVTDQELKAEEELHYSGQEEDIDWPNYLREGWEDFQCQSVDSDEDRAMWDSSSEENEMEEVLYGSPESTSVKSSNIYETRGYGMVPHPSHWRVKSPSLTRQEAIRKIVVEGAEAEYWLRTHSQDPWWIDYSCNSTPRSICPPARTCEIWEEHEASKQDDSSATHLPIQKVSEFKVLHEVLWMLHKPSNMGLFQVDDAGSYSVRSNVSLPSTVPFSLRLVLGDLCTYYNIMGKLRSFEKEIWIREMSDHPPPVTYRAYCTAFFQQLEPFVKLVKDLETRLDRQEETMTLESVMTELAPGLSLLRYLYDIHSLAVTDLHSHPYWVCTTRLLSVLFRAVVESSNGEHLTASLNIFMHSFHVYLNIIDMWLSEGRLEDWRNEFLVTREQDSLQVMPYEEEMRRCGVVPVSLLTKLVSVVKDAGRAIEVVSQLNKLAELRKTVQNKGCLYKEFSENVYNEIKKLKETIHEQIHLESSTSVFLTANNSTAEVENPNLADSDTRICEREDSTTNVQNSSDIASNAQQFEDLVEKSDLSVNDEPVISIQDSGDTSTNVQVSGHFVTNVQEYGDSTRKGLQSDEDTHLDEEEDKKTFSEDKQLNATKNVESEESRMTISKENRSVDTGSKSEMPIVSNGQAKDQWFLEAISNQVMYDQAMQNLLGENLLLRKALHDYVDITEEQTTQDQKTSSPELDYNHNISLVSMHRVLERQLELVVRRHNLASCLVTETLRTEYNLLQHLTVLRTVFFMEAGNLAQGFYSYLFEEIEAGYINNTTNLTTKLQLCVEETYPGFGDYFSVLVRSRCNTDDVHHAIPAISLAYRVEWPVSSVISQEVIDSYNKVFRFLLHIKYAFWTLHGIRFSDLYQSPNTLRVRRLHVLRLWMYHSTNTLHSYFMGLVLRSFSRHLEESIKLADSVDIILQAQNKFLDEVKKHCLQKEKTHVETFIMKLLRLCSSLAHSWRDESSGFLTEEALYTLEEQYMTAYRGLVHLLEAIAEDPQPDNFLWELKCEISHSVPEPCYKEA